MLSQKQQAPVTNHPLDMLLGHADGAKKGLDLMTVLEFDLSSFNKHIPRMARPQSIGHGVGFLNRCGG